MKRPIVVRFLGYTLCGALCLAPQAVKGQATSPQSLPTGAAQAPEKPAQDDTDKAARFFDTVTVSATLNPSSIMETPATVSVIDAETIARRMMENIADLVKFEPGVYIESNLTRIGLNGFNIRGIGGNRVMTQIDGVETSEQFDFGPFNVHQFSLDLDTLKSAEIVRSAGSALYGSDALGGVVSFFTKDPADYLRTPSRFHIGAKTLFDGRADDTSGNVVIAGGPQRAQASLFASYGQGHEMRNKGKVRTENATRTALNPQDRRGTQALGKVVFSLSNANILRGAVEIADNDVDTRALSSRGVSAGVNVTDISSDDTMKRTRLAVDQSIVNRAWMNQWSWNLYSQKSDTEQVVDELRLTPLAGAIVPVNRSGTLTYDQNSYGGAAQARKAIARGSQAVLFTAGGSYKHNTFDMIRDRLDVNATSGAIIPATNLILPSKYFPKSRVGEVGAYLQAEIRFSRLTLVPGVRYDRYSLDADANDAVYIASLSPAAADFKADATSAKVGASVRVSNAITVHGQYAGGFRAPPYSAVNSGFTNLLGGYTSIPNTNLDAETSDNFEVGVRTSVGRISAGATVFRNSYDNFIVQAQRGVNPATGLLEFQYQNVTKADIRGVELRGDARLTNSLRLRASYALIRGNDVSSATDVPLDTIAPDQGAVGLQYAAPSNRWGGDLTVRGSAGQSRATAGTTLFVPKAYGVVDLFGWASLGRDLTLRAGITNLTDATYFEWTNVRGRQATDPTIDRYSSPGVSGLISIGYKW